MVEKGAKLNVKGGDGYTPLHGARTAEIAAYFLKHGVDINMKDSRGWTPLYMALANGSGETAKLLRSKGAKE